MQFLYFVNQDWIILAVALFVCSSRSIHHSILHRLRIHLNTLINVFHSTIFYATFAKLVRCFLNRTHSFINKKFVRFYFDVNILIL